MPDYFSLEEKRRKGDRSIFSGNKIDLSPFLPFFALEEVDKLIRNQQANGSTTFAGSREIKGLAIMADIFSCGQIPDCAQIVPATL